MKIKEAYENLENGLPSYEEINREFEINSIDLEKTSSVYNGILRAMYNKIGIFLNFLEPVISPNPQGIHAFIEVENTTNEEKKEIFDFYKYLSLRYHVASSLDLIGNNKEILAEIKKIWNEWGKIKNNFKQLSKVINNSWERERKKEKVENVS